METPGLWSFGHGTADRPALTDLLASAGVRTVVDVRRFPGSRRDPEVGGEAMARWLPAAGIAYRWEPRLGGRRRVPAGQDPAVDGWWRVTAFRAYAAHMRTPEFVDALRELLAEASAAGPVVFLCSETVWWRCHRRMISDAAVLLHGADVQHLGHDGRLTPHAPAEGARVTDDGLRYDAG